LHYFSFYVNIWLSIPKSPNYVKVHQHDAALRPIDGVQSLARKRNAKKALWVGLKVVEFRPVSKAEDKPYQEKPIDDKPRLPGILYHTQRANWHPSGNGLHHYFAELLPLEAPEVPIDDDILRTAIGIEALLAAEARVTYLSRVFPDKDISLTLPGIFSFGERTVTGDRDLALPSEQLAQAHHIAALRHISLPEQI
jgi:hypothetical protein